MNTHEDFMAYCFELAKRAGKETFTNPIVGSILVYENKVIGEGYHEKYGDAHAERNAINNALIRHKELIPKSTLYVTLEPCFHQGKTPPCVNYILEHQIKRVVISCLDPFPLVAGKSIQLLKESNVEVITGVLENEGKYLIRKFLANLEKRPYIILKFAKSIDGYMGKKDKQVWISNKYSKILVHKWRSEIEGIMVGTQTAIQDNPSLTSREWDGDNPIRIIPDLNDRIPKDANIYTDGVKTMILSKEKRQNENQVEFVAVESNSIKAYWSTLFDKGVLSIMVEGGKKLLKEIIKDGLWDEARIITSDTKLNEGIRAPNLIGELYHKQRLSDDSIVTILNNKGEKS